MSKAKVLSLLAVLSLLVIGYAAMPLFAVEAGYSADDGLVAAARCCTYGSDCATDKCCLAPRPNEADCSQNRKYYCRDCPVVVPAEAAYAN